MVQDTPYFAQYGPRNIIGSGGWVIWLQHVLKFADTRRVKLTSHVPDELNLCCHFVDLSADRPMHLQEIQPSLPTFTGATDASLTGMIGICRSPSGNIFLEDPGGLDYGTEADWRRQSIRPFNNKLLGDSPYSKNPLGFFRQTIMGASVVCISGVDNHDYRYIPRDLTHFNRHVIYSPHQKSAFSRQEPQRLPPSYHVQ